MIGALFRIAAQGAASLVTRAFINRLVLLCEQAYYDPYARDAVQRQIDAEIYCAFINAPPYAHEQVANNILSIMLQYPVQARQLLLIGPHECAQQYPLYAPVIYSIANILLPGWNVPRAQLPVPVPDVQETVHQTQGFFSLPLMQRPIFRGVSPESVTASTGAVTSEDSRARESPALGHYLSQGRPSVTAWTPSPSPTQRPEQRPNPRYQQTEQPQFGYNYLEKQRTGEMSVAQTPGTTSPAADVDTTGDTSIDESFRTLGIKEEQYKQTCNVLRKNLLSDFLSDFLSDKGRSETDDSKNKAAPGVLEDHISRLRELRSHCLWYHSRLYAESLTSEQRTHPEIALELARALFAQGWVRKARDVLDVSLCDSPQSQEKQAAQTASRLARAYYGILCDCRLKEAKQEALAIWNTYPISGQRGGLSDVEVLAI